MNFSLRRIVSIIILAFSLLSILYAWDLQRQAPKVRKYIQIASHSPCGTDLNKFPNLPDIPFWLQALAGDMCGMETDFVVDVESVSRIAYLAGITVPVVWFSTLLITWHHLDRGKRAKRPS